MSPAIRIRVNIFPCYVHWRSEQLLFKFLNPQKYIQSCRRSAFINVLVPAEFNMLLRYYTQQGFRVIGAACKQLKVSNTVRKQSLVKFAKIFVEENSRHALKTALVCLDGSIDFQRGTYLTDGFPAPNSNPYQCFTRSISCFSLQCLLQYIGEYCTYSPLGYHDIPFLMAVLKN